jgi:7-cyano-7-deazaguanine synthase|tara:strand:- start:3992 stop:4840 length:849 start_codon:yes stop_codon:yes gene_type:complete
MTQLEINFKDAQRPKHAIVSLSGGMDSSTLLLKCLNEFKTVTALSFDYGQKHKVELKRARALVDYLKRNGHNVKYQTIKLDGLVDLLDSALVEGGDEVPEGHYAAENMKATVVPNRNKIFASITQAVALSVANKTEEQTSIALGIHSGDHDIYPDCRQEFRDADDKAFREGNWDAERVGYYTPYLEGDKFTILQDGEVLCKKLEIDFDEVYARTNTSYKPTPEGWSDYKSASSVERIEAFIKLGRPDPVQYADETGAVDYETARVYVEQVLAEYEKKQLNIK